MEANQHIKEADQVEYKDLEDIQDHNLWCHRPRTSSRMEARFILWPTPAFIIRINWAVKEIVLHLIHVMQEESTWPKTRYLSKTAETRPVDQREATTLWTLRRAAKIMDKKEEEWASSSSQGSIQMVVLPITTKLFQEMLTTAQIWIKLTSLAKNNISEPNHRTEQQQFIPVAQLEFRIH